MPVAESNKQTILAVVAIVVLVVAGFLVARQTVLRTPPGTVQGEAWFYDSATGELVAHAGDHQGIRAHVFACGSCEDESARFTAYLEQTSAAARAEAEKPNPDFTVIEQGQQVAAPPEDGGEIQWVLMGSMEGAALRESPYKRCETPVACTP